MGHFYFVRHGQTVWNVQNKICGRTDIDLTEKGLEQAKALAHEAADKNLHLILSSPLKRAVKTAKIVSDTCKISVITDERLIEQNYGLYEGVDGKNEDYLTMKRNFAYKYPEGESTMQVVCRIYGFLDEMKSKYKDKNILIVSHGGVCRIINTYFNDMTNDEFYNYTLENAKLKGYDM